MVGSVPVGYSAPVKGSRPGIASTDRRRFGSFSRLLQQIARDDCALDGLAFAYGSLEVLERRALAEAALQDVANPTQALVAFLTVEEDPGLRQRLAALIDSLGRIEHSAYVQGTEAQGEAWLVQSLPGLEPESLHITWKSSKIERIEVESRTDANIRPLEASVALPDAVQTLAPLIWQHMRSGGHLPEGVERFAGFFSLT